MLTQKCAMWRKMKKKWKSKMAARRNFWPLGIGPNQTRRPIWASNTSKRVFWAKKCLSEFIKKIFITIFTTKTPKTPKRFQCISYGKQRYYWLLNHKSDHRQIWYVETQTIMLLQRCIKTANINAKNLQFLNAVNGACHSSKTANMILSRTTS